MSALSEKPDVLVVEDEPDVQRIIVSTLQVAGLRVVQADDGLRAIKIARSEQPYLILLDLMLPEISGTDVCKLLKADPGTARIPVIMLTARGEEIDRVLGFELGADDYITKPFSPRELALRVRAVLRRIREEKPLVETFDLGGVFLDRKRREVFVSGTLVRVTSIEFKLLSLLMENSGKVQSREVLLKEVWNYQNAMETRTVDTHIRRLREKLGPSADCIETFRGFGYCFFDRNC